MTRIAIVGVLVLTVTCSPGLFPRDLNAEETKVPKIRFQKTQLDTKFRSEGVAVGDFNRDGKLDVAAGFVWYEAPDWKMHPITEQAPEYNPRGYSNSFCNFVEDLNKDGWPDLMVIDFPGTPTWWFENPKGAAGPWKKHVCTPVTNNESPDFVDVTGDGKRDLLLAFNPDAKDPDGPERQVGYARPASDPYAPWMLQAVSAKGAPGSKKYSHGIGIGDVNKDGRTDILCAEGWWEAPLSEASGEWKFHPAPFGGGAAHIHVYDFDGDGDNDVLTSSPHAFGIWWHEQFPGGNWKTHEIDMTISQTHSVCVADINGDGLPDFVTGKRFWAHAPGPDGKGGDPGVHDPAVICWYELKRANGKPEWIRHQFDDDSGVGTQFELADLNGDKLLDVVTSNKKGVFVFIQSRE